MNWLREWLPGPPIPLKRVLIYTVALVLVTGVVRPGWYRISGAPLLESYSIKSMDLAMTRAFCDVPSAISTLVSVTTIVRDEPALRDVPARRIAAERAGSMQRFCESATDRWVNNENSLMWLDSWLWRLWPDLSINGLGQVLHGLRVIALVATVILMLTNGGGLVVALISWYWSLSLLQELGEYVHHGYPFMLAMLLVTASACPTASRRGWTRSVRGAATVAAICGIWAGFATNIRTSHFPIYVVLSILLFASAECLDRQAARPERLRRIAVATAMFIAGFYAFQYVAITRHLPRDIDALSRHTIFHSVVIGLAVPESPLSRREGLTWDDGAANAAAQKVDPKAVYLSKSYETALLNYYLGLWSRYPDEMARVYWMKACTAGKHVLEILRTRSGTRGRILRVGLRPMDLLPNGVWISFVYVVVAAGGMWRFCRGGSALGGLLAFMTIPALLVQIEASVVMSNYVINYQSYLAFFAIFISVILPAALAGLVWDRLLRRLFS